MSDLRERLRDLQDHYSTSGQLGPGNERIFGEAADEIASLRAKLESAMDDNFIATQKIFNLESRLESARKALERIANDKKVTEFQSNPHNHPRYIARHALTDEKST